MSYSIIIIIDELNKLVLERFLINNSILKFEKTEKNIFNYGTSNSFISIFPIDKQEYNEKELNYIKKFLKNPIFYFLDTNKFQKSIELIKILPEDLFILIDNDNDCFFERENFIKCKSFKEFFDN